MLLPDPEPPLPRLPRVFYQRDTVAVARGLLGQLLVRQLDDGTRVSGLIVETEAYLGPEDAAAHTYNHHRSPRNESMWGQAATAYVYFTYGMHHCVNVVTRDEHSPQAVLIRALQPVEGHEAMRLRRQSNRQPSPARPLPDTALCSGPAKLCQALEITRDLDGVDLATNQTLWLELARQRALPRSAVGVGPRIGIANSGEWAGKPLRFAVRGNAHVSRPRRFTNP
ncbi:MAG: DNA-3-methyladenine glycosylase [Phycisphaeraceae bacterium]